MSKRVFARGRTRLSIICTALALIAALACGAPIAGMADALYLPEDTYAPNPDCECFLDECICFIQLGDEGQPTEYIIARLRELGYLPERHPKQLFDDMTLDAVLAFQATYMLAETGMLNGETMNILFADVMPVEERQHMWARADRWVWVPTDGGIRHHRKPCCSNMHDPRLVSELNAYKMNMLPCRKCRPEINETISMREYIESGYCDAVN